MTDWGDRISRLFRPGLVTVTPILLVALLVLFFPPDGNERMQWMQFMGRLHPLTVHFPIALFLLVPLLELVGRLGSFSYLRAAAGFVLGLATIAASVAALLGWSLARSGAYSGPIVTQHMWAGVAVAAVCWGCWFLRERDEIAPGRIYSVVLASGVLLVGFTGYRGGQLSQGENHLTEFMPGLLRTVLGLGSGTPGASVTVDPNTFYGARVQPIFTSRCVSCHGADKHKADLRLDSYAALMRGGKHGLVVKGGNAAGSELLRRITLAPDNDDFMPKEGKRPLAAEQVKTIELWIAAGASATEPVDAIKGVAGSSGAAVAVAEVTFEEVDPGAVVKLRADIAPKVAELQKQYPNILDYESRGSANLALNASILGQKFGDGDLAAFAPLADHISVADLSRTAITDHSASAIAGMKHLRVLRVMNTKISDAAVGQFSGLEQLESLSLFGTSVTSAVLPSIAKLPKLAHCYVGETKISPAGAPPELVVKLVF